MDVRFKIPLILTMIFVASCSMLDHRDFYDQMDDRFGEPMFTPSRDFPVVQGDEGRAYMEREEMSGRVPATAHEREMARHHNSITQELRYLESKINEEEYEAYLGVRDQFDSDYERIYFLRLLPNEKIQYLEARNMLPSRNFDQFGPERSQFHQEISMNMRKEDVLGSWGEPHRRDYAGNPSSGNERWAYSQNGRVKFIYFEGGEVAGWVEQ